MRCSLIDKGDGVTLDFANEETQIELARATLVVEYGATFYDLPKDYLIPRIPQ